MRREADLRGAMREVLAKSAEDAEEAAVCLFPVGHLLVTRWSDQQKRPTTMG